MVEPRIVIHAPGNGGSMQYMGQVVRSAQEVVDLQPGLVVSWNFPQDRAACRAWCERQRVPWVSAENGIFPHYQTLLLDPRGFCWESSLPWAEYPGPNDPDTRQGRDAWTSWHQQYWTAPTTHDLPQGPYALWVGQLLRDRVNTAGLNLKSWAQPIMHFASNLPDGINLAVRPHPRLRQYGELRAWHQQVTQIAKHPRVVVHTAGRLFDLIHHAQAVAGMNSTALYEASLFHNKPTFAYAASWYENHDTLITRVDRARVYRHLPNHERIGGVQYDDAAYRDWFVGRIAHGQVHGNHLRRLSVDGRYQLLMKHAERWGP